MIKKPVVLSGEERAILSKLNNEQLRFLVGIRDGGFLAALIDVVNLLTDTNKNVFFGLNETSMTAEKLSLLHAELRGESGGQIRLIRLIQGASGELLRREELTKKLKEKK